LETTLTNHITLFTDYQKAAVDLSRFFSFNLGEENKQRRWQIKRSDDWTL